jgi:phosphoribosylanthranilate isomerase
MLQAVALLLPSEVSYRRYPPLPIVRSKICGITRVEDALVAAEAGADAIGLVFYAKSPRAVTVKQARAIIAALPPFVTTVGLFVNASRCELNETLDAVPLDMLQFHGDETPADCEGFHRPWYKALRVKAGEDIRGQVARYVGASAILLDTFVAGVPGGTGEVFDWSLIPANLPKPLILAGGLNLQNIQQAVAEVRPFAVDVSGGVEVSKGIKDAESVREFVRLVRAAM